MSQRRYVAVIAGVATILAAVPLSIVFATFTWLFYGILAVAVVVGAAMASRAVRLPVVAQVTAMLVALVLLLSWLFPSGREYVGFIPNLATLRHFGDLFGASIDDMRRLSIPVPDRPSLLFVVTLGIGVVAITVDVLAIGLGHPALAGLPMLAIYSVPVAVAREGIPWLPFAIGAVGYLWLLVTDNVDRVRRWGRRFSGDGRDIDTWEPSPLAASGRRVGLVGIALAVVVPVALPSMPTSVFERFYTGTGTGDGPGGSGATQFVNPVALLSNNLKNPEGRDVLRLETDNPSPLYLRLAVADQVTPDGFTPRSGRENRPLSEGLVNPRDVVTAAESRTYRARVTMLDYNLQYLPLYAHPTRIENVRGPWFYDRRDSVVWSPRPNLSTARYNFEYAVVDYDSRRLRQAPKLAPNDEIRRYYTRLPRLDNPANTTFIANLVTKLTADKTNDYDKTMAVLNHFSRENQFRYSLETESGTSGAAIVDFLTNKKGFCQQYAAAMAWLLRAADVPARLVIGLAQGSRRGNSWTMTTQDFHAWVEVYFHGFGWVPFDPTPAVTNAASLDWAPRPDDLPDPATDVTPGPGGTAGTDPEERPDRNRLAGDPAVTPTDTPNKPTPSRWPSYVALAGLVALVALLATPALRRARIAQTRRRRLRMADVATGGTVAAVSVTADTGDGDSGLRRASHAAWDELLDTMIDLKLPIDDAESPRATAQRLTRLATPPEHVREGLALLAKAEERARYARTVSGIPGLLTALAHVRAHLARTVPWHTRVLAVLLPPSILRRWRLRYLETISKMSAVFRQWRETVVRVVKPRRLFAGRAGR